VVSVNLPKRRRILVRVLLGRGHRVVTVPYQGRVTVGCTAVSLRRLGGLDRRRSLSQRRLSLSTPTLCETHGDCMDPTLPDAGFEGVDDVTERLRALLQSE
jgi:hypothetical protein